MTIRITRTARTALKAEVAHAWAAYSAACAAKARYDLNREQGRPGGVWDFRDTNTEFPLRWYAEAMERLQRASR